MESGPARSEPELPTRPGRKLPLRVLFLCSDNSARSPMAEAILRCFGKHHFTSSSAGITPADAIDPHVLALLKERDVSSEGLATKGLEVFEGHTFDYVITLSDPAREQAPELPDADVIHWSFADPEVSVEEQTDLRAFEHLFGGLSQRIRLLMIIAERMDREAGADKKPIPTVVHKPTAPRKSRPARHS